MVRGSKYTCKSKFWTHILFKFFIRICGPNQILWIGSCSVFGKIIVCACKFQHKKIQNRALQIKALMSDIFKIELENRFAAKRNNIQTQVHMHTDQVCTWKRFYGFEFGVFNFTTGGRLCLGPAFIQ